MDLMKCGINMPKNYTPGIHRFHVGDQLRILTQDQYDFKRELGLLPNHSRSGAMRNCGGKIMTVTEQRSHGRNEMFYMLEEYPHGIWEWEAEAL